MDYLIESVGEYGLFQYKATFIVGLISALSSASLYATVFIAAEPNLICKEKSFYLNNNTSQNLYLNLTDSQKCDIWSDLTIKTNSNYSNSLNSFYECNFDLSYYGRTIISEWNLICDRQHLAALTQTFHILGSIFGFCGGVFGDRYGRRSSVLIFSILLTFTLLFSQFLLISYFSFGIFFKYVIYSISQFLIGLLVNCLYCTSYVLLMEFTTDKYRTSIANMNSYVYVLGEILVLVVFYFRRDWHFLNWVIGIFSLAITLLSFMLLESPAWLISINKYDDAIRILKKISKLNGKKEFKISFSLIETLKLEQELLENENNDSLMARAKINDQSKLSYAKNISKSLSSIKDEIKFDLFMIKDILTPMKTFIKTSLLFYIWAALMLLYYGISLGVTDVDLVDPYLMYFLSCIAEFIGYVICYVNDIFGRKKTMFGFLFILTLTYASIAYLSGNIHPEAESSFSFKAILLMSLGLIGKCAVSGAYHIAYIFSAELYPTAHRNTAVLFLTCFGGISSLVAPQINNLKSLIWNPLPYIIYSVCALFSCICVLFLPETHKKSLKN